MNTIFVNRSKS